jgi:hypothetical protein
MARYTFGEIDMLLNKKPFDHTHINHSKPISVGWNLKYEGECAVQMQESRQKRRENLSATLLVFFLFLL